MVPTCDTRFAALPVLPVLVVTMVLAVFPVILGPPVLAVLVVVAALAILVVLVANLVMVKLSWRWWSLSSSLRMRHQPLQSLRFLTTLKQSLVLSTFQSNTANVQASQSSSSP